MPKVSVIMPVFNGESYISEAIYSVLNQQNTDLELIVVNDGSTDRTSAILKSIAKTDNRLRVLSRQKSGGAAIPRNDGIAMAQGEYLCFLDHDDLYDPDRTCQLVDGLDKHPEWVAVFHDLRLIDKDGRSWPDTYLTGPNFFCGANDYLRFLNGDWFECSESFFVYQSLKMGALHTQSTLIAKNRLPRGTVRFDPQFIIGEDTDLWIRLGLNGKIGYLNRVLSSYRQHEESITRDREKYITNWLKMHENNYQRLQGKLTNSQIRQYRAKISAGFSDLGYFYYQNYRMKDSRVAYSEALAYMYTKSAAVGYIKSFLSGKMVRELKKLVNK